MFRCNYLAVQPDGRQRRKTVPIGDDTVDMIRLPLLLFVILLGLILPNGMVSAEADCATTVSPGDDVGTAAGRLGSGVICLGSGTYQAFVITGSNVSVRGAGRGSTTVNTTANNSIVLTG